MKTGWIVTSGDGSECGHHHKTWSAARKCLTHSLITPNRKELREEAQENGETWRGYVNRFAENVIYYRNSDGNLTRNRRVK